MLSENLVQQGHKVTVIAAVPHYPTGQVPLPYQGKLLQRSQENGVEIVRVRVPSVKRANLVKRLLQFICYQIGATAAGLRQQYDVVLVTNPALEIWLPFTLLVTLRHKPAIFSVHDVYPDVGIELGIFRHQIVIKAIAALERFCLRRTMVVRILSESFIPGLLALGVPESKMVLIYDWVDTDLIRPLPRDNAFAQEHKLLNQFVVLYAGNIGLSQGLEHVLTAAELLAKHSDIRFVFVGDGAGREGLTAKAKQRKLTNVQFLPFQPRARLPEVLATADVSLVPLKRGMGLGSLPSKSFSILASGRPLVVSVDENSDAWNLIKRADAGLCVPPENPESLAEAILTLKQNETLRKQLGRNGRNWAERNHSPRSAAEQFEKLLSAAITSPNKNLV